MGRPRKSKAARRREGVEFRKVYRAERQIEARHHRDQGLTYAAIAKLVFVSKPTVRRWLLIPKSEWDEYRVMAERMLREHGTPVWLAEVLRKTES